MRPGIVIVLLAVACSAPADLPQAPPQPAPAAPVQTDRRHYVMQQGRYGSELTMVATFRAPADRPVYIVNCNDAITTGLQRLVGDKWVDAWAATTNACLSPAIEIAPGGTRTEKIVIVPNPVIYPPNANLLESGTYRAAFHNVLTSFDFNARPFGPDLPIEQRVSAPFTIEVPANAPRRPPEIFTLEPPEGARVAANAPIHVSFALTRAATPLNPGSLRLYIDGNDVTDQTLRAGTEDVPMSVFEVNFTPPSRWSAGKHDVRVELKDRRGNTSSYAWSFFVE